MKVCSKCKQAKPETEFSHNVVRVDGLNGWCKACVREKDKARREKIKDAKNAVKLAKTTREQRMAAAAIIVKAKAALAVAKKRGLKPKINDLVAAAMDDVRNCGMEINVV